MELRGKARQGHEEREQAIQRVLSSKMMNDGRPFTASQAMPYLPYKDLSMARVLLNAMADQGLIQRTMIHNKNVYSKNADVDHPLRRKWRTQDNSITGLKPYRFLGAVI